MGKLPHTEWSMIPRGPPPGVPDVCIFDFTNLYAARVAARVTVRKGQPLLGIIVGDSLLEPFWPEGTGCARGFLSAMDAGWMMRDWFLGQKNPLKILAEREMTRSILNQTTDGNLVQNFKSYSIDPRTRYKVIPKKYDTSRITNYYDSDNPEEVSFLQERFQDAKFFSKGDHTSILKRFRQKFKKTKKEPFAGVVNVAIGFLITILGCAIASVFAVLEFLYGAIMFLCQGVDSVPATV